jgi:uncharacterized protein with PIN domain
VIVVDSSALVAILEEEPEHREFKAIIEAAPRRVVSPVGRNGKRSILTRQD